MDNLEFSYNWNKKLFCRCFTTMRLRNDSKFFPGAELHCTLKTNMEFKDLGTVRVLDVKHFKINQINEFVARIDTGYSAEECKNILRTMYKNMPGLESTDFSLILLIKTDALK